MAVAVGRVFSKVLVIAPPCTVSFQSLTVQSFPSVQLENKEWKTDFDKIHASISNCMEHVLKSMPEKTMSEIGKKEWPWTWIVNTGIKTCRFKKYEFVWTFGSLTAQPEGKAFVLNQLVAHWVFSKGQWNSFPEMVANVVEDDSFVHYVVACHVDTLCVRGGCLFSFPNNCKHSRPATYVGQHIWSPQTAPTSKEILIHWCDMPGLLKPPFDRSNCAVQCRVDAFHKVIPNDETWLCSDCDATIDPIWSLAVQVQFKQPLSDTIQSGVIVSCTENDGGMFRVFELTDPNEKYMWWLDRMTKPALVKVSGRSVFLCKG